MSTTLLRLSVVAIGLIVAIVGCSDDSPRLWLADDHLQLIDEFGRFDSAVVKPLDWQPMTHSTTGQPAHIADFTYNAAVGRYVLMDNDLVHTLRIAIWENGASDHDAQLALVRELKRVFEVLGYSPSEFNAFADFPVLAGFRFPNGLSCSTPTGLNISVYK